MEEQKRQAMLELAEKAERQGNKTLASALRKAYQATSPEAAEEREQASERLFAQLDEVQQRFDAALAKPL